jgi:hypothetical protein
MYYALIIIGILYMIPAVRVCYMSIEFGNGFHKAFNIKMTTWDHIYGIGLGILLGLTWPFLVHDYIRNK